MPKLLLPLLLIASAFLITACSFSLAADITPPPGAEQPVIRATSPVALTGPLYPLVPPDPTAGASIFAEKCAPCHGQTGLGDGPDASQLPVPVAAIGTSNLARSSTPAEWYALVTQGNLERYMPPFLSLTDRQRWDVVAYAFSLSAPADSLAFGEELYQENCLQCHGVSGKGDGPEVVNLPSPPRDLTDQAFMADYPAAAIFDVISQGIEPDMPAYAEQFDETQIWALTDYLRSFTFATSALAVEQIQATAYPSPDAYPYPYPAAQVDVSNVTLPPSILGTVIVTLVNGSGGEIPEDAQVTLYGFDAMQMAFSQTLTSGPQGIYTFGDIEMLPERAFLAGVDYQSGTYGSDVATVDPASPLIDLQIVTYDSSTDTSRLITDRLHLFFDFSDSAIIQVVEVYIVSNPTNLSIVPAESGEGVVFFPLPQGYTDLQFEEGVLGERFLEVPGGFMDTLTVQPGMSEYQVVFAFNLPYDRRMEFTQAVSMDTSAVVVMLPDGGVNLTSAQLLDGGVRDFQGTAFRMYNGSNLNAGDELLFSLSGNPGQSSISIFGDTSWQNIAIGVGSLGLVLVLLGLWLFRRNQTIADDAGEDDMVSEDDLPFEIEDPESLMDAIIALDDQYQAGDLPEDAYARRRAELKERLQRAANEETDR